jgi:hypothetical protein
VAERQTQLIQNQPGNTIAGSTPVTDIIRGNLCVGSSPTRATMATVCFINPEDVPAGIPITRNGEQVGRVIESRPHLDKFVITAEIHDALVTEIHRPETFSMGYRIAG